MTDTIQWVSAPLDERRTVVYSNMEMRAEGEGNMLTGYAAVFDSPSEPMPFIEYVKRGAFMKTLNDGADVRLLIDHEGVPLARTKSGTLALEEDELGLRVEAELDPMNPDAARIISAMKRGDLTQMSFAFRTIKDSWSNDRMTRELREVQLYDVSVVTFPAYEATVAELRGRNQADIVADSVPTKLRSAQLRLARHK
jgi:HK97 family phage prohead protease